MSHPLTARTPLIEGVPIELDGKTYILPPCSLGTLKRQAAGIQRFATADASKGFDVEALGVVVSLATEALRRNYPDITEDFVADALGLESMMDVFQAAMDVSGLLRKAKGAHSQAASSADAGGGGLGEPTGGTS